MLTYFYCYVHKLRWSGESTKREGRDEEQGSRVRTAETINRKIARMTINRKIAHQDDNK